MLDPRLIFLPFALAALSLLRAAFSFAPWVPSRAADVRAGLELAELRAGETLYDLGCGDGRVVVLATRVFGARAVGVELSRALWVVCQLRRLRPANRGSRFVRGDLFDLPLGEADVVYCYGAPWSLRERLLAHLDRTLRPGSRVVVYRFPLPGRTAARIQPAAGGLEYPIYLYSWPATGPA